MPRTRTRTPIRPPCSPFRLCVIPTSSHLRHLHLAMTFNGDTTFGDDVFAVSSSTALGMGENLLNLLNTVIMNLPESELRRIRLAMEHSLNLADDLLYSVSASSAFDRLTMSDGTCV